MLASAGGWQRPDAQEFHVNNRAGRKSLLTTLKRMGFQRNYLEKIFARLQVFT